MAVKFTAVSSSTLAAGTPAEGEYVRTTDTNKFYMGDGSSQGGILIGPLDLSGYVTAATFDANTILAADADNTPVAVTIAENDLVGRLPSGNIAGVTMADLTEETTPATGDFLLGWESGGAIRKFDVGDLPTGTGWDGDIADIDLDGGTDIGADLADADLILVDDGAGGTNRKSALSRVWAWLKTKTDLPISMIESTDLSGSDGTLITGTAGTSGDLSVWNADGDLVDGPTPPTGDIVGTTDTQTLTNKTISTGCVVPVTLTIACSDETTALTTGTAKATFRMPHAMTLTGVRASVTTAPTGATLNVDINEGGTSVLSTVITIDAGEKTSTTAETAAVISDSALADDAEITIDIDQVGSTVAGAGLKVTLIGTRTL